MVKPAGDSEHPETRGISQALRSPERFDANQWSHDQRAPWPRSTPLVDDEFGCYTIQYIGDYHNPLCFTNWLCGVVCFRCAFRGHTQKAFEFHSPNTHNFSDSACWMGYQLLGESTILWTPWKWTTRSKLSSRKWRLTIMWATADARLTWKFHLPPTPGAKLPMFWMSQGLSIYKGMLQVSTFCLCVLFEAWEWWTVAWGSWLHVFMSR